MDNSPAVPPAASDSDELPELSERFLAAMALAQTPEQQEVARGIYDRLAAGASVDEVHDLIEKMVRVVVTQRGSHPRSTDSTPGPSQTRTTDRGQ